MDIFSLILLYTGQHIILVAIAMVIAISIGIPLGIMITRYPKLAQPILGFANIIQTIPSLAIFGFLISVPFLGGIGAVPAIVALTLYALLPLIRNTYIGITGVDPAIREAGRGMGMTDWELLIKVEIPLAMEVILAGVRVATVISVGIATIAAAIGAGGLGVFIFQGISMVNNNLILAGAIPAALLALLADYILGILEQYLTRKHTENRRFLKWQLWGSLSLVTLLLVLVFSPAFKPASNVGQSGGAGQIVIGSKNFTEQTVLGELIAQQIENKTQLNVDRKFNLGGTFICHEAVKAGQIDGYVEYTGTAWTAILKKKPISNPEKVYREVKRLYKDKFKVNVFPPLGFENTFAIIIRQKDAQKFKVKTLSEVAKHTPQWKAAFGYEFYNREDGYPGLAKTYKLKFAENPQVMDLGLIYRALSENQVDIVVANSTDGLIPALNLVVLEDDKGYFPPYEAIPVFNQKTLEKYPQIREAIEELAGKISTEKMQQLNYEVDNNDRPVEEVVREFLATL